MTLWYLLIAAALLIANGFFVGVEFALIAARRSKIEQLAEEGNRRATSAYKSIRELTLTLAGAQLGITMCSLGLGYVAEPAVAKLIESGIHGIGELPSTALHTISFVIALTIVTFFHMVFGEMAPKNVVIAEPEKSVLWLALPFRAYMVVFRPIIIALNWIATVTIKTMGIEPQDEQATGRTAEELAAIIEQSAEGGMIREVERRLLAGAAAFGERDATAAMIPRTEVVAIRETATPADIEGLAIASGHSRFPVYGQNLDQIYGFFHAKDLLKIPDEGRDRPIPRRLIRPMLVVPESLNLHPLLIEMRRERKHFAVVVDEHGGTAGIVTLEDLLEELVGEIRDEYDVAELGVETLAEDRFLIPGTLRIDEAADHLDVRLPEGEYETVAGFLMDRLGRIPRRRDVVEHNGWRLWVRSMHRHRVVQVLVERTERSKAAPAD
ncbi:MAG: hemolysin family protein [Actinomycetota bacterium]|nr:hemolysin family protein [Actinomycetota bacterium]